MEVGARQPVIQAVLNIAHNATQALAERIAEGLPRAFRALAADQGPAAAKAIMTTDPFPKEAAARVSINGVDITVGGMAKGSGMIEPMMATMLGFITTDANVPAPLLTRALSEVVHDTFNAITADGECSTNDCVLLMASGASDVEITDASDPALIEPLRTVAGHLAREIVRGGEGATKLLTVRVTGAASLDEARRAAQERVQSEAAAIASLVIAVNLVADTVQSILESQ